jgi:glycerate kinase
VLGGDPDAPGAGAAGGTAYGFATLWGAQIVPGASFIAELSGLTALPDVDLVLTGEGRFDAQSTAGKVVGTLLATHARVWVVAGQVTSPTPHFSLSLTDLAGSVDAAMADPTRWLTDAGARAAHEFSQS